MQEERTHYICDFCDKEFDPSEEEGVDDYTVQTYYTTTPIGSDISKKMFSNRTVDICNACLEQTTRIDESGGGLRIDGC